MSESFIFLMIFALGGGSGGDLLDFAQTESYWQAREQRIVDVETMTTLLADDQTTQGDRLMAIRTLGELGKADGADPATKAKALEALKPLVDSKEPFVGQYAKRSIAWVKGEDPAAPAPVTAEQLNADLALLPHTSQIVGQMRVSNAVGPIDLTKFLPDLGERGPKPAEMIAQLTGGIAEVSGMIGNARLDSITVGGQFLGQGDDGYAVVIARGQYDRISVQIAFQDMAEKQGQDSLSFYSIGDIEVIANKGDWDNFVILMPSDQQFILMVGESDQGFKMFPVDETADLIQKGDAQLAFNEVVTKQLNQVDREKALAWVAMQVPGVMRQEAAEYFGPFEAGHASAIRTEDGNIDITWQADGNDAQKVADAVKQMNTDLEEGRADLRRNIDRDPQFKPMFEPMLKMMDSLHLESEGKTMTGGIQVPGNIGSVMQMMFMGFAVAVPAQEIEVAGDVAVEAVAE